MHQFLASSDIAPAVRRQPQRTRQLCKFMANHETLGLRGWRVALSFKSTANISLLYPERKHLFAYNSAHDIEILIRNIT